MYLQLMNPVRDYNQSVPIPYARCFRHRLLDCHLPMFNVSSPIQSCGLLYGGESLEVRVPSPWATGRTIETVHPVRDSYKYKETVTFPGAKNLYLKFDARCSSQYDYDKVIVYAGDTPSCPKVVEYGGNTHGFGSRSVLGKGWPKDLVKVSTGLDQY